MASTPLVVQRIGVKRAGAGKKARRTTVEWSVTGVVGSQPGEGCKETAAPMWTAGNVERHEQNPKQKRAPVQKSIEGKG